MTALADVKMLYHDDLKTSLLHMGGRTRRIPSS